MLLILNTTRFKSVEYLEQKYTEMIYNGERVNKAVLKKECYNLPYNKVVKSPLERICELYFIYYLKFC